MGLNSAFKVLIYNNNNNSNNNNNNDSNNYSYAQYSNKPHLQFVTETISLVLMEDDSLF